MTTVQEQYMLRVRRNSLIDVALRALDKNGSMTVSDLQDVTGKKMVEWFLPMVEKNVDNLRITKTGNKYQAHYVNVLPTVPTPVGIDIVAKPIIIDQAQVSTPAAATNVEFNDINWPQAPPMLDSLGDMFIEPSWYKPMRAMVQNGRHIALSGPPGVGKDTAVQELAAKEGAILVTVGGDAGFRRRDLIGQVNISQGHSFLDVAEYAAAVVNGWWALLTEVNAADADALMFINTQLAPPYIINIAGKAYPVHPNFRLFVSYNPGLVGTKPLPQSFKDRFYSIQVGWFSANQLTKILVAHGMPEDAPWSTYIVEYGKRLWDAHVRGQIRYQVTSRRLMDAVTLLTAGIVDDYKDALRYAVVAAIDSPIEAKVADQLITSY